MSTKKTATPTNSIQQAELILKLYELRRETVMREARSYIGGDFMPTSADEFVRIVSAGGKHTGFILQVYGYWGHGRRIRAKRRTRCHARIQHLPRRCTSNTPKIQPYLAEFREKMNMPEFLISIEQLIDRSKAGRRRIAAMRKNLEAIAEVRSRTMQTSYSKKKK